MTLGAFSSQFVEICGLSGGCFLNFSLFLLGYCGSGGCLTSPFVSYLLAEFSVVDGGIYLWFFLSGGVD